MDGFVFGHNHQPEMGLLWCSATIACSQLFSKQPSWMALSHENKCTNARKFRIWSVLNATDHVGRHCGIDFLGIPQIQLGHDLLELLLGLRKSRIERLLVANG